MQSANIIDIWCFFPLILCVILEKMKSRKRVMVLSSVFYFSLNTLIWCSEQENSLNCLTHEMDILQGLCVTPSIYGVSQTVITLTFETIKTGSWKSAIWFMKQLEYRKVSQTPMCHPLICGLWVLNMIRGQTDRRLFFMHHLKVLIRYVEHTHI